MLPPLCVGWKDGSGLLATGAACVDPPGVPPALLHGLALASSTQLGNKDTRMWRKIFKEYSSAVIKESKRRCLDY